MECLLTLSLSCLLFGTLIKLIKANYFYCREIDEEALEQALSAAVTCTILAAAGPQRSRVLATLYKVNTLY